MSRRISLLLTSSFLAMVLSACQSTPHPALYPPAFPSAPEADIWQAGESPVPLQVDGTLEEVWRSVAPKVVFLVDAIDGSPRFAVILRAMWHQDMLYISAQWPDSKPDTMPDRYVWNENSGLYETTQTAEDMFSIEFEMNGQLLSSMFTTRGYTADVWHWKAGRGNEEGYADDKTHIVSGTEITGVPSKRFVLYDGTQSWMARPADAGKAAYRKIDPPKNFVSPFMPAYERTAPDGSRADVRAKGVYDGTYWTLEFSRKLNTGNSDDVRISHGRDLPVAVAIHDAQHGLEHAVSQVLHLRLRPALRE